MVEQSDIEELGSAFQFLCEGFVFVAWGSDARGVVMHDNESRGDQIECASEYEFAVGYEL